MFNELSAGTVADTQNEGRRWLEEMIGSAVAVADGQPLDLVAVRSCDIYGVLLGPGYTVSDWLHDGDRDLRKLFYKAATKITMGEDVDGTVKERFSVSEFSLGHRSDSSREVKAPGLGLAYLLDGVAVSLASEERWCQTVFDIRHLWLDSEAQEHTETVQVVNVSRQADVESAMDRLYQMWKRAMLHQPTGLSRDTLSQALASFRHLVFGLDVEKQFRGLALDDRRVIWGKLIGLDSAVWEWRRSEAGRPTIRGLRPEGKATMDQFGDKRVYRNRHGENVTYKLHVSAGSRRVHFRIEPASRVIEVGYVGKHLPTKKFPN